MVRILFLVVFALVGLTWLSAFRSPLVQADTLTGAWQLRNGNEQQVLQFQDGYVTHTTFDKEGKRFLHTSGGRYDVQPGQLSITYEFDTKNKEQIGTTTRYPFTVQGSRLNTSLSGTEAAWQRVDDGREGLSGLWEITAR
ncbi:MAG TPA: hypothetical protein VGE06_02305, partial [Flavisolibacter sp.]